MYPVCLFRTDTYSREEYDVAASCLKTVKQRTDVYERDLVVGRYSVLPFYRELELDVQANGARLINTFEQHSWVADGRAMFELADTPRSWTEAEFPRSNYPGPFVVKGATNSKKHLWSTHMYAETRADAVRVGIRLREDGLVGTQPLIYREYVPLVTYEHGLNGLPFTNEWRLFFLADQLLASGYYWSEAEDAEKRTLSIAGVLFGVKIAREVAKHINFFVLDIAEKANGGWTLVEVNDAQMSGLSMCDPQVLYRNLAMELPTLFPD